jgi:hypothetical protein
MQEFVLTSFRAEIEKIGEAIDTEAMVARAVVSASLGGAAANILMAPITAAVMYQWGTRAAAAFAAANTVKGMAIGGIGGALTGGKKKEAAAWGENVMPAYGAARPSGGFVTKFRSAGMATQPGTSSVNTTGLLKGLSNVASAGLKGPPKLPGAPSKITKPSMGAIKTPKIGGSKGISMKPPSLPKPG